MERVRHIPRQGHTRSTHGPITLRTSHNHDSYLGPLTGFEEVYEQVNIDMGETVTARDMAPVTVAQFAQEIRPVSIVDVLPTLPDFNYPEFSYAVLTTDERLYKNIGEVWVKGVDGADIVADTITAGQIAAGAIGATEIAAEAVHADKLSTGARMGANLIPNGSFEDGVADGTLDVPPTMWTFDNTAGGQGYHDSTGARHGAKKVRLEITSTPGTEWSYAVTDFLEMSPDTKVAASCLWMADDTIGDVYFTVRFYGSDFALLSSAFILSGEIADAADTWYEARGYATSHANTRYMKIWVGVETPSATPISVSFDDVRVQPYAIGLHNSDGNVTIDAAGITIINGKLTITDEFGTTVFTALGFEGSWSDYMKTGVFNGSFASNLNATPAMGRTATVPYWTLSQTNTPTWDSDVGSISWTVDSGDIGTIRSDRIHVGRESRYLVKVQEKGGDLLTGQVSRRIRVYGYSASSGGSPTTLIDQTDTLSGATYGPHQTADFGGTYPYIEIEIQTTWVADTAAYTLDIVQLEIVPALATDLVSDRQTYTLTVSGGGTATFTTRGWYQQIGPICFIHIDIQVTATGSGAGTITFNLPVTTVAGTNQTLNGYVTGLTGETGPCAVSLGAGTSASTGILLLDGTTLLGSDLDSTGGRIRLNGWYFTE